jgi:peptide/nickel transport system permease protein
LPVYLLRRFISGLIILFLFVSLAYFAVNLLLPGDFASQFSLGMSPAEMEKLRAELGLNQPVWQRYLHWISGVLRGDLGVSYTNMAGSGPRVTGILKGVLPSTVLVFGLGTVLAFLLGEWLGRLTGWSKPNPGSGAITFSAITLYTSFPPWLAFLLFYFIGRRFSFIPSQFGSFMVRAVTFPLQSTITQMLWGLLAIGAALLAAHLLARKVWRRSLPAGLWLALAAGLWAYSWRWMGMWDSAIKVAQQAMLPLLAYVLLTFGEIMLIMRTSMVDTLHEEYINTARAKGLPESRIRDHHAARNAILPVISRLVTTVPYLLTGMVMIEISLHWTGVGSTLFYAVGMQNVPLGMGLALVIGAFSLAARLILEVVQYVLDPRLRRPEDSLRSLA